MTPSETAWTYLHLAGCLSEKSRALPSRIPVLSPTASDHPPLKMPILYEPWMEARIEPDNVETEWDSSETAVEFQRHYASVSKTPKKRTAHFGAWGPPAMRTIPAILVRPIRQEVSTQN